MGRTAGNQVWRNRHGRPGSGDRISTVHLPRPARLPPAAIRPPQDMFKVNQRGVRPGSFIYENSALFEQAPVFFNNVYHAIQQWMTGADKFRRFAA